MTDLKDTTTILVKALHDIYESQKLAIQTHQELCNQQEQLNNTIKKTTEIKEEIKVASKTLNKMNRCLIQ